MNIDIEITFERAGRDVEFGTAVFESFMRAEPTWDPVVTQDAERDTLLVDLTIPAVSLVEANLRLAGILRAVAGDLEASAPMVGVHIGVADGELAVA